MPIWLSIDILGGQLGLMREWPCHADQRCLGRCRPSKRGSRFSTGLDYRWSFSGGRKTRRGLKCLSMVVLRPRRGLGVSPRGSHFIKRISCEAGAALSSMADQCMPAHCCSVILTRRISPPDQRIADGIWPRTRPLEGLLRGKLTPSFSLGVYMDYDPTGAGRQSVRMQRHLQQDVAIHLTHTGLRAFVRAGLQPGAGHPRCTAPGPAWRH